MLSKDSIEEGHTYEGFLWVDKGKGQQQVVTEMTWTGTGFINLSTGMTARHYYDDTSNPRFEPAADVTEGL